MTEQGTETAQIVVGDRVRLWLGSPKRGGLHYGEVIGVDNLGHRGIEILFDTPVNDQRTCYATHDEVEVRRKRQVMYSDGSPSREYAVEWECEHPTRPGASS